MTSVSPADARAALPDLSLDDVFDALQFASAREGGRSLADAELIYLNHLVSRGDLSAVAEFLEGRSPEERQQLVNNTSYHTHFGNSLHACAYWNTGETALEMFAYLIECGARPIRDYYENLPWEMNGILYVPVVPIRGIDEPHQRNRADFVGTHRELRLGYMDLVDPTYWNTGEAALEMFAYLIECGARPIRAGYMDLVDPAICVRPRDSSDDEDNYDSTG